MGVTTPKGGAPTPLFFVNVASKGFSSSVSPLDATLAGKTINVASKELKEEEQGSNEVTR